MGLAAPSLLPLWIPLGLLSSSLSRPCLTHARSSVQRYWWRSALLPTHAGPARILTFMWFRRQASGNIPRPSGDRSRLVYGVSAVLDDHGCIVSRPTPSGVISSLALSHWTNTQK